jgi:nicotinate-nucleotide pyrophosphorylase (carboxylating)
MQELDWPQIDDLIQRSLEEDLGRGDITSEALVPVNRSGRAAIVARASGILAGIDVAALVFREVDPFIKFHRLAEDGKAIQPMMELAHLEGKAQSLLKGERVALNFLQHLSGIATLTSQYVASVASLPVRILDTRKTLPGLRMLEKYAVSAGGGQNHRFGLYDMVLIKDNHISILGKDGLNIADIVRIARMNTNPGIKIEIEVTTPSDALGAAEAGADIVMLDNMNLADMSQSVILINHRAIVEASGGVNLDTVRSIAETGVDWISVGALTHSVKALDISLEFAG